MDPRSAYSPMRYLEVWSARQIRDFLPAFFLFAMINL